MATKHVVIETLQAAVAEKRDRPRNPFYPPSTAGFGEWLEREVAGAPYLEPGWYPDMSFVPETPRHRLGADDSHPGLLLLTAAQREQFVFAMRPGRGLSGVDVVRDEALLAGFVDGDVQRMRDGLYTYNRLRFAEKFNSGSGCDHSANMWEYLEEISVGDDDLAHDRLPSVASLAKNGYRLCVVALNVIRALRYGLDRDTAHAQTAKFAAGKSTKKFEALLTRYLLALMEGQADTAYEQFGEIARTWASTPWARSWRDPLHRVASLKLHGFAVLGERVFPGISDAARGADAWSAEFAALVDASRRLGEQAQPVVDLPGAASSLSVVMAARPFEDYARTSAMQPSPR